MKRKYFSLLLLFSIAFSPSLSNAQNTTPCTANWWARCCKCKTNCLVVDPLPAFGHCRECKLLCPGCREELGDLTKALEELKQKNRILLEELKKQQANANRYNSNLTDAMVKTYGQESGNWSFSDPSSWRNLTMSGFNSSIGKFAAAEAALLSDFSGVGLPLKLTTDVISTLQTQNVVDAASNSSGTVLDIVTYDGILLRFEDEIIRNAGLNFVTEMRSAQKHRGRAYQQAVFRAKKNFIRESKFATGFSSAVRGADMLSTAYDIFSFIQAGADLITNLTSIYENYADRQAALKKRLEAQNEILKNAELMACIRETKDSLDHGGLGSRGFPATTHFYAGKLMIGFLVPGINSSYDHQSMWVSATPLFSPPPADEFWEIDTFKIKSALSHLKQQQVILHAMFKSFIEDVVPSLIPWILKKWQELSPATQVYLLKDVQAPLKALISNHSRVKSLNLLIAEDLQEAISGYESFYITGASGQPANVNEENIPALKDKWLLKANEKVKPEMGRVNLNFPMGVDWSIDFYTVAGKYYTNRSSYSRHANFYDIVPGTYQLILNAVPIENVTIEKGKELKLKTGILNVHTQHHWDLYNESKDKYYTSYDKPKKFALPVGVYQLRVDGKDHRIVIREKESVKFEMELPSFD